MSVERFLARLGPKVDVINYTREPARSVYQSLSEDMAYGVTSMDDVVQFAAKRRAKKQASPAPKSKR